MEVLAGSVRIMMENDTSPVTGTEIAAGGSMTITGTGIGTGTGTVTGIETETETIETGTAVRSAEADISLAGGSE
jgi:hypothetical protein